MTSVNETKEINMISSKKSSFRALIVGTGGQGVIRASQIMAWAAVNEGFKVRTAETHGMAQRGGSVVCYVGIGEIAGPLFPRGMADVILAFEEVEALRNVDYANPNTLFLISNTRLVPPGLYFNQAKRYPSEEEIISNIQKVSKKVFLIDANKIAKASGESRAENVVMLAYLLASGLFPVKEATLLKTTLGFVPAKAKEANQKAFDLAYTEAKELMKSGGAQ